ncbi:thiosulfate sulfurtransferase/rhodanese-like domain-containing protein 3 isoform X2 [Cebus imitator]|uniref:thiosulfate sulfurtransferase/rhodanese-like domain-containing protein 3 isoform X2 n=1 Tax=Cebus imitator TaxID=2715852 RepID=UPI00189AC6D8|nr:thiosulfate sulfurtransferase/rhodanese-like domain-containing protein 3 isoform X2 [Cebus imitator]
MPLRFKAVITPCGITRFSRRLAGGRPRARSSAPGGRSRSGRSRRKWSAARLAPGNGAALVAAWDCAQGGPRVSGGCALRSQYSYPLNPGVTSKSLKIQSFQGAASNTEVLKNSEDHAHSSLIPTVIDFSAPRTGRNKYML